MNISEFRNLLLTKIAEHDGQWSWYQLDRAVISKNPTMNMSLMPTLQSLESEGLILPIIDSKFPGQPRYLITDKGAREIS